MSKFNQSSEQLLAIINQELINTGRTDIAAQIQSKNKRALQSTEMFRKNLNATAGDLSGDQNLVEVSDMLKKGAITLNQGKLVAGEIMAITKFALEYGSHASVTDSATIDFSNLRYSDAAAKTPRIPTKLLNAKFTFLHGSNVVLTGIVGDYIKEHDIDVAEGLGAENPNEYRNVNPVYVADDKGQFQLRIEFGAGTMPSAIHHIGFKIDGIKIVDR